VNFGNHKVVVLTFVQKGCGACAAFEPKFRRVAARYGRCVPTYILDANAPYNQPLADRLKVQATPATFALRRHGGMIKIEGDVPEEEVVRLFDAAARAASCGIG